jgi:Holliday junction DNA helicase RuvA
MIASLTGTIRSLSLDRSVIEVGGVGYAVAITPRTSQSLVMGAESTLFTTLVVREDSMTLFGFLNSHERDLFEILQTVTGIGPKVALAITGALTGEELASAVVNEDVASIERVPGIGKKGAQRLILELKGKLEHYGDSQLPVSRHALRDQLVAALTGLGFSPKESDAAINRTLNELSESGIDSSSYDLSALLKLALQSGKK